VSRNSTIYLLKEMHCCRIARAFEGCAQGDSEVRHITLEMVLSGKSFHPLKQQLTHSIFLERLHRRRKEEVLEEAQGPFRARDSQPVAFQLLLRLGDEKHAQN
jgi:hypothetical protein